MPIFFSFPNQGTADPPTNVVFRSKAPPVVGSEIPQTLAMSLVAPGARPERYLAVAARAILALELNVWGADGQDIRRRENHSLRDAVKEIFKTDTTEDGMPPMPIKKNKLRTLDRVLYLASL